MRIRGEGHGKRIMNFILKHFQKVIHTLDDSLGFFECISKDLGLQKIYTGLPFGKSFISSNLNIIRQPVFNSCLGGRGLKLSGYKTYACDKCSMRFMIANTDMELIRINKDLRFNVEKKYQTTAILLNTQGGFLKKNTGIMR